MDELTPIKQRRLHQEIAARIQASILDQSLQPGDRLATERELAEQYSVSRTVIREALKVLETRGLVSVQRGSGVFVTPPDSALLAEMFEVSLQLQGERESLLHLHEVRQHLEGEIVALAAERRTEDDLEFLDSLLEQTRVRVLDAQALIQLDLRFHLALARATRNPVFGLILNMLMDLLRKEFELSWRSYPEWPPAPVIAQHEAILLAVRARDPVLARRRLKEHLAHTEALLTRILSTPTEGEAPS